MEANNNNSGGVAAGTNTETKSVKLVFIKFRDLPNSDNYEYSVTELCRACEHVTGAQSMVGSHRTSGLWRLYSNSLQARAQLLVSGIALCGVHVSLTDNNPFLVRGQNGMEVPTTCVIIGDVPLSFTNKEIEGALVKFGCVLMSPIKYELDRDENGKLTR